MLTIYAGELLITKFHEIINQMMSGPMCEWVD